MKHEKSILGGSVAVLLLAPAALIAEEHEEDELEFDEAHVFFELNNTDGDLGIHALIDGEPWKRLSIANQDEMRVLDVKVRNNLRRQGLTEFFFESAEPTFDELPAPEFFERFPEGTYEIEGITLEGDELESETDVTHAMPAPPEPTVNGKDFATFCDDEDPAYEPTAVSADGGIVIAWPPVSTTHPSIGSPNLGDIDIYNYEVVVETEIEVERDGEVEEFTTVLSIIVPPDVHEVTIPPEFIAQSDEFKYEVLAREASFNQTATESCFVLEGDD